MVDGSTLQIAQQKVAHHRQLMMRAELEAVIDHDGLDVVVEDRTDDAVLEAADLDDLVMKDSSGRRRRFNSLRARSQVLGSLGVTTSTSKYGLCGLAGLHVRW